MSKKLEIKDSLYYYDLMYFIRYLAGYCPDCDLEIFERIAKRERDTRAVESIDATNMQVYCISPFQEDLFKIIRWISEKSNTSFSSLSDISQYSLIVLESLTFLEKKQLENEMLIQLISVIKDMGLENKFSLGQPTQQCVCLNKTDYLWEVYIVERGISFEKSVYEDCVDACIEVINQLADSKQMYESAKEKFGMVRKLVPNK